MTEPRPSLLTRLGVPPLTGFGKTTAAVFIDTIGVGLLLPISLLFFTLTTDLGMAQLGVTLTVATALSLPAGLIAGGLTDRIGPKAAMVSNNLCSAAGYLLYLVADDLVTVFLALFLVAAADRMYWACWSSYVHKMSAGRPFERWFAFLEAIKAAAMGMGALLASVVLAVSAVTGAYALVWLNVLTCVIAAVLFVLQDMEPAGPGAAAEPKEDEEPELLGAIRGWRLVLGNRNLLMFALGQALLSPIMLLPVVALPLHLVENWLMPAWVASFVFALNCTLTAVFQSPVTHAVRHWSRARAITLAGVLLSVSMLLLVFLPGGSNPWSWTAVIAIGVVLAIVDILYMPAVNAVVAEGVPDGIRGRAVSICQTSAAIGLLVFPAVAGILLETDHRLLWIMVIVTTMLGALCFWRGTVGLPDKVRFPEVRGGGDTVARRTAGSPESGDE